MADILELQPNVPVEVALAYGKGKEIQDGKRVMFTLVGGRVLFLDREPARRIEALGAKAREPISLVLKWSGRRGDPKDVVAWLSTEAEKGRAREEAIAAGDGWTARRLEESIERTREIRSSIVGAVPVSPGDAGGIVARAAARVVESAPTSGLKMPLNLAVIDAMRIVAAAAREAGENWSDGARQGLVSSILEIADRQGWIGPWKMAPTADGK